MATMTLPDIEEQLRKYVGGKYSSRELNIATYFYKLGLKQNESDMTERVIWKEIPKDKDGFFDENSDLYDRLPIIITEEFKDFINLYYIDKENWHETVADLSRQRFVHYIEVRELK